MTTPNGTVLAPLLLRRVRRDAHRRGVGDHRPRHGKTHGRAWPLLAGERGEYAVAAGQSGAPYLASMAAAAGASDMLAEQVWDGRAPTGQACCPAGEGTRSATPLLWSHAVLVRLAWTIQDGRPVDQQPVVARPVPGLR